VRDDTEVTSAARGDEARFRICDLLSRRNPASLVRFDAG